MPRRERWSIVGAILSALLEETTREGGPRMTVVASRANLPYDRLQEYLREMVQRGLVVLEPVPHVTPKGVDFVRHYRQWQGVLERFGLGADV